MRTHDSEKEPCEHAAARAAVPFLIDDVGERSLRAELASPPDTGPSGSLRRSADEWRGVMHENGVTGIAGIAVRSRGVVQKCMGRNPVCWALGCRGTRFASQVGVSDVARAAAAFGAAAGVGAGGVDGALRAGRRLTVGGGGLN